jgi:hypothetical protein
MTDTARAWGQVKRRGWSLSQTVKGTYRQFALLNPRGESVATMFSTGYYPKSATLQWATMKVLENESRVLTNS